MPGRVVKSLFLFNNIAKIAKILNGLIDNLGRYFTPVRISDFISPKKFSIMELSRQSPLGGFSRAMASSIIFTLCWCPTFWGHIIKTF